MSLIVDAHEDIASNMLVYGRDYAKSAQAIRAREAGGPIEQATGTAMLGLPNWLAGGVAVIFGTLFAAPERWRTDPFEKTYSTPNEAYLLARQQIDIYQRLADEQPQFKLIFTRSDLEAVLKTWDGFDPVPEEIKDNDPRQIGIVMLMENADPIRTPEEVELWYERGLRLIGPAWAATRYCGGTNEPGPLTDDGVRLLKAMNNLNMTLDTSHMDERAFFQALDRYDGPIIASHSNPRALTNNLNRHLSDDMLKALIAKDGVIGTVPYNKFLLRGWEKGDPKDAANISHVVRAIDYVCQKAGDARHAAIGSDFDGGFGRQSAPAGFDTVADLKIIGPALKERGYAPADIDLILGGNWLRVLRRLIASINARCTAKNNVTGDNMNIGKLFGAFQPLSSQTMILRKIVEKDIEEVFAIYSNDCIFEYCGIIAKKNKATVLKSIGHFERDFKKRSRIKWGIALKGNEKKVTGIIEAMDFNRNVNQITIGYFLHPDYWHQGYATEAVRILVSFLFEEVGVNRIQAEVMPANIYSKKVLLKNGFLLEGTLRQAKLWAGKGIVDLEFYSLLASDYKPQKRISPKRQSKGH